MRKVIFFLILQLVFSSAYAATKQERIAKQNEILKQLAFEGHANAQDRYLTRNGHIKFFSSAPLEDIEAHNYKVLSIVDLSKGQIAVDLLIKAFEFEKKLMQEHFNENYMESSKYPKATFKGKITNISDVNFKKDGTYKVKVSGNLTMHGVTKAIETDGQIIVKGKSITAKATFNVTVADYKIEIPKVVREKIAKEVEIDVDLKLAELKK